MDIWQHKESRKFYVQIGDSGSKLTLITPFEGIKTFSHEKFERIFAEDIQSLNEQGLLTDSQITLCKNNCPELSIGDDCGQVAEEIVESEELNEVIEVTIEEFVQVLSYWVTQVQMKPSNVEFIAGNIKFNIPRVFKKKLWDFHNELIALFVSIAHLCTIQYLSDKKEAKNIIKEVIGFISKIAFPSSSHSSKGLRNMIGWSAQVDQRRRSYAKKYSNWNSNTFPSMGRLFLEHFNHSKDPIMASIFMATYIQGAFFELSEALERYKIIGG